MQNQFSERSRPVLIYLLALSGGAGKNAVIYANTLAHAGHAVVLVCGTTKGQALDQSLDERVAFVRLKVSRNLLAIPGLRCAIRRSSPSRVLVIGPSNMLPFVIAAGAAGFRGEVTLRVSDSPLGMQAVYAPWLRLLKRWSFAKSLPRADRVIALTRAMAAELDQVWAVPPHRIHYIPNGIVMPGVVNDIGRARSSTVLCVGRLAPQKDHATLLRAFAILQQVRPCRLMLAGEGRERARLEDLARSLGIADSVSFLGHVRDVGPLYRSASLTVLASRHEGFPNVLIEALAHGCPVVATDCPTGPAEVINSPAVGLLAKVGDPEDLAACMGEALKQRFDLARLRIRANDFSMEQLRIRIVALFKITQGST